MYDEDLARAVMHAAFVDELEKLAATTAGANPGVFGADARRAHLEAKARQAREAAQGRRVAHNLRFAAKSRGAAMRAAKQQAGGVGSTIARAVKRHPYLAAGLAGGAALGAGTLGAGALGAGALGTGYLAGRMTRD